MAAGRACGRRPARASLSPAGRQSIAERLSSGTRSEPPPLTVYIKRDRNISRVSQQLLPVVINTDARRVFAVSIHRLEQNVLDLCAYYKSARTGATCER